MVLKDINTNKFFKIVYCKKMHIKCIIKVFVKKIMPIKLVLYLVFDAVTHRLYLLKSSRTTTNIYAIHRQKFNFALNFFLQFFRLDYESNHNQNNQMQIIIIIIVLFYHHDDDYLMIFNFILI